MIFKRIIIPVLVLFVFSDLFAENGDPPTGKASLSGKVTDKTDGGPLPGVNIYFPDLKTGTVSNVDGKYYIDELPAGKVTVQVSFIGYQVIVQSIDLSKITEKDFQMDEAATEISEVVVTGQSGATDQKRTPTPISVVPRIELLQTASSNIIDALAKQPGVSEVTTGPGISKPVIRGLGYNRVVVINDGIRQEGQQWGDEHGIEIDGADVDHVEILKGPASLAYGSDALAGVVNMLPAPVLPVGQIKGSVMANYQANNGMAGISADLAGNLSGLVWDLRYSQKMAHDYRNKYDGYVFNSAFRENALNMTIGLNRSWGYSHLSLGYYHLQPGIVEGERDSLSGNFIRAVALNDSTEGSAIASGKDFTSYKPFIPRQQVYHYKAIWNTNLVMGNGSLKVLLGYQQNRRQEFADVLVPDQYQLYFLLNSFNYDLRYVFPEKNKWNMSVGINGMQQSSQNKGTEFLVPEYNLFDIGAFAILKKNIGKLDISGGLRYDMRLEHGLDLYLNPAGQKVDAGTEGNIHRFDAFNSDFSAVSGSLGATYQLSDRLVGKLNISHGFRAPNIAELGANGVHEGTFQYMIGNPALKAETSWEGDLSFAYNSHHVSAELDLFDNNINNYIFARKLSSVNGNDSINDGFQTFKYVSGKAKLYGGEFRLDIHPHPLDWLHFENTFSYVRAIQLDQPDSTRNLPLIPAPKWTIELRFDIKKLGSVFRNAYLKFSMDNYFTQDKVYYAYNTETRTPGYSLFGMGLGSDIQIHGKTRFSVYLSGDNLTNVAYQSHLSRLKYAPENYATGRMGVYNMGRNFSVKVVVPIGIKD